MTSPVSWESRDRFYLDGYTQTRSCVSALSQRNLSRNVPPIAMEFAQRCLHIAGSDVCEVAALLREIGYDICSEKTRQPYKDEMDIYGVR